jgi:hypothetical protein
MRTLLVVLFAFAFVLVGCGGQAPPPATPAGPAAGTESPGLPKALGKPRMTVEYAVVHQRWVEKTMTPNASDVSAWYETPEGKGAVRPERREATFKTKKEADAALARAKKGEVASEETAFASAADATFEKLAPGDAAIVNVSSTQFVVVAKARPSDAAIEKAYKKAKALETTQKLAVALLSGLQKPEADARAVIASVVGEILGEKAVADPDRPQPVVVDDDRLRHARLSPKAKDTVATMLKTAKAGETVKEPIVDGGIWTVARALPPSDH